MINRPEQLGPYTEFPHCACKCPTNSLISAKTDEIDLWCGPSAGDFSLALFLQWQEAMSSPGFSLSSFLRLLVFLGRVILDMEGQQACDEEFHLQKITHYAHSKSAALCTCFLSANSQVFWKLLQWMWGWWPSKGSTATTIWPWAGKENCTEQWVLLLSLFLYRKSNPTMDEWLLL